MDSKEELEFLSVDTGIDNNIDGSIEQQRLPRVNSDSGLNVNGTGDGNAGGGDNAVVELFKSASHPKIAILHVFFKVLGLVIYMSTAILSIGYVKWFIPCVIIFAVDFWVVKNITGRLLVGLRWWNNITEEGESEWKFESIDDPKAINSSDYAIFWYSMYLNTLLWGFIGVWNALGLRINNLVLVAVALALQLSNLVGYWKCSKDAKQKLQSGVQDFVSQGALGVLSSRFSNGFSLLSSQGPANASTVSQA